MKKVFAVLFLCSSLFVYAQSRDDIIIGIPMPVGGTSEQQQFFRENFIAETTAASYTVSEDPMGADYVLNLEIKKNMILYDDGTEEEPPPEEKQYLLALHLVKNDDTKTELVYFDFPFTEMEEMYEFNLFLLYQAMANVPLTKLSNVVEYDHWRNKWLYIRASFDYAIINYSVDSSKPSSQKDVGDYNNNSNRTESVPLYPENSQIGRSSLGFTLGLELQFLNWMSVEGWGKLMFGDTSGNAFVPAVGLALKFPLKPSKHFMLEPYAMVDFPQNSGAGIKTFSPVGVGAGFQFGVKGGEMGAFFIDVNFVYNLGEIHIIEVDDLARNAYWNRWVLSFGIGYKIGFMNRNPDDANASVRAGSGSVPASEPMPEPAPAESSPEAAPPQ